MYMYMYMHMYMYMYMYIVSSDVNNANRIYLEKLDLRSDENSVQIGSWSSDLLQIARESGSGPSPGDPYHWGGRGGAVEPRT